MWESFPAMEDNDMDWNGIDTFTLEDEIDLPGAGSVEEPDQNPLPRHGPNQVRKGYGRESRSNSPDKWDAYDFEVLSPAYRCLRHIGYEGITTDALWKVLDIVERDAKRCGVTKKITRRNRAAHRRKPCAFHWLDENWIWVQGICEKAFRQVLGETSGVRQRGRKSKSMPESFPLNL
jgi:hypothetical protein